MKNKQAVKNTPAHMPTEFSRSFKGYQPSEVDGYIEELSLRIGGLETDNRILALKLSELLAAVKSANKLGDESRRMLGAARRQSEEIVSRAKGEAAGLIEAAKYEVSEIILEARHDREVLIDRLNKQINEKYCVYNRLCAAVNRAKTELTERIGGLLIEIDSVGINPDIVPDADPASDGRADKSGQREASQREVSQREVSRREVSQREVSRREVSRRETSPNTKTAGHDAADIDDTAYSESDAAAVRANAVRVTRRPETARAEPAQNGIYRTERNEEQISNLEEIFKRADPNELAFERVYDRQKPQARRLSEIKQIIGGMRGSEDD